MDWMDKWHWILDAIVAIPGLKHGDVKWLAEYGGFGLWNTQLTRALKAAVQDRILEGDGRSGYRPTLLGLAALDAYRHERRYGEPGECTFEGLGASVTQTLQANLTQYGSNLAVQMVKAMEPSREPAGNRLIIDNNPGLVLRGVLKAKTVAVVTTEEAGRTWLTDIILNSYTANRPPGLWSEHWLADSQRGGQPILTVDQERTALLLAIRLSEGFNGPVPPLIVRRAGVAVPADAEAVFSSLNCEAVVVAD